MKHPRDVVSLALSLGAPSDHGSGKRRPRRGDGGGAEFVCKTCSRAFASFQALGGHRTSHLRGRGRHGLALGMPGAAAAPAKDEQATSTTTTTSASKPPAPASHQCHVCGLGFDMGQALGGHMRRHRDQQEAAAAAQLAPPVLLQLFV